MAIIEDYSVHRTYIVLKFAQSLRYDSVTADKFTLQTQEASPVQYGFKEIQMGDDYNSITRMLTLYFRTLPTEGHYDLVIDGLRSGSGNELSGEVSLYYDYDNVDSKLDEDEFTVEDKSINSDIVIDGGGSVGGDGDSISYGSGSGFRVLETSPSDGELFVENDLALGSMTVRFSERPNMTSLNDSTVKVQKKEINGTNFKWETLPTKIALDASEPVLYIYMPSLDATPVYYRSGHEYFEPGHRYRLLLSQKITTNGE